MPMLCVLPWLLLGAGIAIVLLAWLVPPDRYARPGPRPPSDHDEISSHAILGLSEACEKALGARARPGRLRRTSTQCIASLIRARVPVDQQPTEQQMNRWREQAGLICAGRYADLRRLQLEWTGSLPSAPEHKRQDAQHDRSARNPSTAWVSMLGLGLLLLGMVLLILAKEHGWCAGEKPPTPCAVACPAAIQPKTEKTIVLNANLLFDYNKAVPYTLEHEKAFDQALREQLQGRTDITISKIVAHTDPIGSDAFNRDLAQSRGEFVRKALNKIVESADMATRFTGKVPATVVGLDDRSNALEHDSRFWSACYRQFYTNDPGYRPLLDLDKAVIGARPTCSAGAPIESRNGISSYAGCRAPVAADMKSSSLLAYQRLDRFRELASCLAPMRHVLITFSSSALASK